MAVQLSDGGHLAKMADGRIVRFDSRGRQVESLRPADAGYSYWLSLLHRSSAKDKPR